MDFKGKRKKRESLRVYRVKKGSEEGKQGFECI